MKKNETNAQRGFQFKEGFMLAFWNTTLVLLKLEHSVAPGGPR